jgi:hypothetical protein
MQCFATKTPTSDRSPCRNHDLILDSLIFFFPLPFRPRQSHPFARDMLSPLALSMGIYPWPNYDIVAPLMEQAFCRQAKCQARVSHPIPWPYVPAPPLIEGSDGGATNNPGAVGILVSFKRTSSCSQCKPLPPCLA